MTANDLKSTLNKIRAAVNSRRFYSAFALFDTIIAANALFRPLASDVARLRETYTYLVNYALSGLPDPSRATMLNHLAKQAIALTAKIKRLSRSVDNPSLYYSTLRYEATQPDSNPIELAQVYLRKAAALSRLAFVDPALSSTEAKTASAELERLERRWFRLVWTLFPLAPTSPEYDAVASILQSDVVSPTMKALTLGAVFLGNLEEFDNGRIEMLLNHVENPDRSLAMRATVFTAIAIAMAPDRSVLQVLKPRFDTLSESKVWRDNLRAVFTQLLRSRDTERVTRKLTDEILPSMKDLGKDLSKMARKIDKDDPESIDEIPEWQELLENSELASKMREVNEMQEEGSDVLMTTFGHLKNFPFFNEISNWFLPFDPSRSDIVTALQGFGPLADLLTSHPGLCDNDRYSVTLAMADMPAMQRNFLTSQLEANSHQLAELQAQALNSEAESTEQLAANQVRSLYRFFKLYNRKEEFADPFLTALNLLSVDALKPSFNETELCREAAEFFYSHGYYSDALPLFQNLESTMAGGNEADIYFKTGCILASLDRHAEALEYFEKSELFDDDNEGLLLKMAVTHRTLGNHRRAVDYFRRVSAKRGGDDKIDLFTAASLAATEQYAEAASIFYRVDYNRGLSTPFVRELAMCEYRTGELDKCRKTLARIKRLRPADRALLTAVSLAEGNYGEAASQLSDLPAVEAEAAIDSLRSGGLIPADADRLIIDIVIDSALNPSKN